MIHSLSGGVIKSDEIYTFIKIEIENLVYVWLICPFAGVKVGDIAYFEDKSGWVKNGKIVRIDEKVSGQTPPVPKNRIGVALKVEKGI